MAEIQFNADAFEAAFDHVNLADISPNLEAIPEAFYVLKFISFEPRVSQAGDKSWVSIRAVVQDDPKFTGRNVYDKLWNDERGKRMLRRLMDNVGIPQGPAEPLAEYLRRLTAEQPTAKYRVITKQEKNKEGEPITVNRISFQDGEPA
jgi:hypothetical protein